MLQIRSTCEEACHHTRSINPEWDVLTRIFMRSFMIMASSLSIILASSISTSAQTISESQMRAANLARMQAELMNGGGS